jgi:hypothetical protein
MTSRGQFGPIVHRVSTEDDTGKGTNVILWCCPESPSLDTIMHRELIPQEYVRCFSLLGNKLDLIPYLRTDSTVLFVMKDFLAQSLVHRATNCNVVISMTHMVLLHLQLDLHVLLVTRYSPNSYPFRSFPLGWCRQCCVSCWSTHITELSISSWTLTMFAQFSL